MTTETISNYRSEYYQKNKERIDATNRAWREANPEKVTEMQRAWRAANEGRIYTTTDGYAKFVGFNHPACSASGVTNYHRIILWDKLNGQDVPCNWCGRQLFWSKGIGFEDGLLADHVDTNKQNNSPDNLVPSCHKCNVSRPGGQNRVLRNTGLCSVDFCDRDAAVKGMCKAHYTHVWNGKDPQPIGQYKRGGIGKRTDEGRECLTCGDFKPWGDYYLRSNGKPSAHCKPCSVEMSRQAKMRRQEKNGPCSVEGCTTVADIKGLCSSHYVKEWNENKAKETNK